MKFKKIFLVVSLVLFSSALCAASGEFVYWGKNNNNKSDMEKQAEEDKDKAEDEYSEKEKEAKEDADKAEKKAKDKFYK